MRFVIIVRHGETDANKEGIMQGQMDFPLNGTGKKQALEAGERLKRVSVLLRKGSGTEVYSIPFDSAFSSDLKRAHETAQLISKHHKSIKKVVPLPDLREANFGDFEGMNFSTEPEILNLWKKWEIENDFDARPPNGESKREVFLC
jgi:broad specificity phosphatase PhoE